MTYIVWPTFAPPFQKQTSGLLECNYWTSWVTCTIRVSYTSTWGHNTWLWPKATCPSIALNSVSSTLPLSRWLICQRKTKKLRGWTYLFGARSQGIIVVKSLRKIWCLECWSHSLPANHQRGAQHFRGRIFFLGALLEELLWWVKRVFIVLPPSWRLKTAYNNLINGDKLLDDVQAWYSGQAPLQGRRRRKYQLF